MVQQSLGDASRRDVPQAMTKYVPVAKPVEPVGVKTEAVGVLTICRGRDAVGHQQDRGRADDGERSDTVAANRLYGHGADERGGEVSQ